MSGIYLTTCHQSIKNKSEEKIMVGHLRGVSLRYFPLHWLRFSMVFDNIHERFRRIFRLPSCNIYKCQLSLNQPETKDCHYNINYHDDNLIYCKSICILNLFLDNRSILIYSHCTCKIHVG